MGTPVIKSQQITSGPGLIRAAALGSTIPTVAVVNSVFSHTWDAAWFEVGSTDEGVTETHETTTEDIEVAESVYPVRTTTTAKSGSLAFAMAHINVKNWLLALNAAASAATTTGTTTTTMTKVRPPLAGNEIRIMLAWESTDTTELIIAYQCFNGGSTAVARRKGADKATLPVEFRFEMPDSAIAPVPWDRWLAGTKYTT